MIDCSFGLRRWGVLEVTSEVFGGSAFCNGQANATIDIDADGTIEVVGGLLGVTQIPIRPDQPDLLVRVSCDARAECSDLFGLGGSFASVTVRFIPTIPPDAGITTIGTGCGGAQLAVTVSPQPSRHRVTIQTTGGFAGGGTLLAFGLNAAPVPLPLWPSCVLEAPIFASYAPPVDASGNVVTAFDLLAPVQATVLVQAIPFDLTAGALRASPAAQISFAD